MHFRVPSLSILAVLLTAFVGGCGTMANLEGRKIVSIGPIAEETRALGGVRQDTLILGSLVDVTCNAPLMAFLTFPVGMCFLADLPFSCVGDLLTLPMVMTDSIPARLRFKEEFILGPMADETKQEKSVPAEVQPEENK